MSRARTLRIKRFRDELIAELGYFTTDDVARVLRRRKAEVIKLLDAGVIPSRRDGKWRRIRAVDLEQYLSGLPTMTLPQPDVRMRHKHRRRSPTPEFRPSADPEIAALFE